MIPNRLMDMIDSLQEEDKIELAAELFSYFDVNTKNCITFLNQLESTDRCELAGVLQSLYDDDGEYIGEVE